MNWNNFLTVITITANLQSAGHNARVTMAGAEDTKLIESSESGRFKVYG